MKTIAYYALHYGAEYLAHSVRSIQDHVDEIHMLYTAKPSFGHGTSMRCPETQEQLFQAASRYLKDQNKVKWHYINRSHNEGHHRDQLKDYAPDADVVLHVDADEIWEAKTLALALDEARYQARDKGYFSLRARFVHFWRSFNYVCYDAAMPERLFMPKNPRTAWSGHGEGMREHVNTSSLSHTLQPVPVLHFGYAQSEALMRYKWQIHGHQSELRPNWFEEKFLRWSPGVDFMTDVHPTCVDFWSPQTTNAELDGVVKTLLGDHHYYGVEVIR